MSPTVNPSSKQAQEKAAQAHGVDKANPLPAYAQLAQLLRGRISSGEYPPGSRLPAESSLAQSFGVSAMTARQAVGVLAEEGLVKRVQGSGTFVRKVGVVASNFGLDALGAVLANPDQLTVRIIKAQVQRAEGEAQEVLELPRGEAMILVERVILFEDKPFTLHVSQTGFDPASPTVESMLDTAVLTSLIFQEGYSNFKKGELRLLPVVLGQREAEMLELEPGRSAFKLEHLFYGFDDRPAAFGWFIVAPEKMPLVSRVGVWDE